MRAPAFWQSDGPLPRLLSPLAALYAAATARRVARPGWRAPVPVLCCGNAGAGGAGKTTVALDLGARLLARGVAVAFLSRGYRGRLAGRVDPARHTAGDVGDEALLLAALAPTWVDADRARSARAAVAAGAQALVLDDGLQNPTLYKDVSLLVVDGAAGFGNGRVIPAGPLREPVAAAAARCRAAVLIGGAGAHGVLSAIGNLPVLHADLVAAERLDGVRVLAFAGIGRPEKFAATLRAAGAEVAALRPFPDHHSYSESELDALFAEARRLAALPVTTPKDAARLTPARRAALRIIGVRLAWHDEAAVAALLDDLMTKRTAGRSGFKG
jgi:tetraacyldisaccharide 4'-kinase